MSNGRTDQFQRRASNDASKMARVAVIGHFQACTAIQAEFSALAQLANTRMPIIKLNKATMSPGGGPSSSPANPRAPFAAQIGRAAWWARGCQTVSISVVGV